VRGSQGGPLKTSSELWATALPPQKQRVASRGSQPLSTAADSFGEKSSAVYLKKKKTATLLYSHTCNLIKKIQQQRSHMVLVWILIKRHYIQNSSTRRDHFQETGTASLPLTGDTGCGCSPECILKYETTTTLSFLVVALLRVPDREFTFRIGYRGAAPAVLGWIGKGPVKWGDRPLLGESL